MWNGSADTLIGFADRDRLPVKIEIRRGQRHIVPVMVDWTDWGGHWQVIIGIDTCDTDDPYKRIA